MGIATFFPLRCPVCDKILPIGGEKICKKCYHKLSFVKEPSCKKCGKQLQNQEEEYCSDCRTKPHLYKRGIGLLENRGISQKSIYAIKYKNKREYVDFYTDEIAKRYGGEIDYWKADLIMPVPLHKKKLIKRGFNQAEMIAKSLSQKLGIPVSGSLERVKNTVPLKTLKGSERRNCLAEAFRADEPAVRGKRIILVDDIYTTGSTIDECSRELKAKGARETFFITLAIGDGM